MELETVSSGLRKLKFPPSAEQGIKFIHSQCEKFSHSGMPRLAQWSSLIGPDLSRYCALIGGHLTMLVPGSVSLQCI